MDLQSQFYYSQAFSWRPKRIELSVPAIQVLPMTMTRRLQPTTAWRSNPSPSSMTRSDADVWAQKSQHVIEELEGELVKQLRAMTCPPHISRLDWQKTRSNALNEVTWLAHAHLMYESRRMEDNPQPGSCLLDKVELVDCSALSYEGFYLAESGWSRGVQGLKDHEAYRATHLWPQWALRMEDNTVVLEPQQRPIDMTLLEGLPKDRFCPLRKSKMA